jgi:hypothetical protein
MARKKKSAKAKRGKQKHRRTARGAWSPLLPSKLYRQEFGDHPNCGECLQALSCMTGMLHKAFTWRKQLRDSEMVHVQCLYRGKRGVFPYVDMWVYKPGMW